MRRVVKEYKDVLGEQPVVRFEVNKRELKLMKGVSYDQIRHRLAHQLADILLKEMEVIHYCRSDVTGNIYSGYYDYAPHNDPICTEVWEARLPLFDELYEKIDKLELCVKTNKAYEKYYEDPKNRF